MWKLQIVSGTLMATINLLGRFVVHGAVDGYSRVLLYLKCETKNHASTVLSAFRNDLNLITPQDAK